MPIDFSPERWEPVKRNFRLWWEGKLGRPLICMTLGGRDPGRPAPALPAQGFQSFYDLSVPAEAIVDRWDYDISCTSFMGDAFPQTWPNFGPGVIASFIGASLNNGTEGKTVWFHPIEDKPPRELRFTFNPDSVWFRRICDIYRAAVDRWHGLVQIGMTDLGGNLDILSTFLPADKLLLALYDCPDEVKRLTWEAHEAWWRYFDEFNRILKPVNPGYTAWTPILSDGPYYMLQCDFCYMIGPRMFDEFVRPEIAASCRRLTNSFYHLDGKGQLPHLDSLLGVPELKGIQWVPGAGAAGLTQWPEVYRRIRRAGKRIQMWDDMSTLDVLTEQLGSAEGIVFYTWAKTREEASAFLKKYNAL